MVRIADFYDRSYDADAWTDELKCRDCHFIATWEHGSVPPVGEMLDCPGCGLPSRIPTLPSQAGMLDPPEPVTSERS